MCHAITLSRVSGWVHLLTFQKQTFFSDGMENWKQEPRDCGGEDAAPFLNLNKVIIKRVFI
jgi:hypothetical protein